MKRKKPGPKGLSETAQEEVLAEVAKLDRRGYTQWEIKKHVKLSQSTVSLYLKKIRGRYLDTMLDDQKVLVAEKLEQYREIRREAFEAWERSKKNKGKKVDEHALRKPKEEEEDDAKPEPKANGNGHKTRPGKSRLKQIEARMIKVKETITREGRLPGVEYLRVILDTYEAERALLGLDEAIKIDLNNNVIDWAAVAQTAADDPLEKKIALLGGPVEQVQDLGTLESKNNEQATNTPA